MFSAACCFSHTSTTGHLSALSVDSRKGCAVQSLRHFGLHEQACASHSQMFLVSSRRCSIAKRATSLQRAAPQDSNGAGTSGDFNLTEYVEAKVERGKSCTKLPP